MYDDFKFNLKNSNLKKRLVHKKDLFYKNFDIIVLSPGIDVNKCELSQFLKRNYKKIFSDLDVFYDFYKNDCITITGTNGKSTTCKLLFEILSKQNFDVRLVGNIGNPILSAKK